MPLNRALALVAIMAFVGSATAGIITIPSTEVFPTAGPTWGTGAPTGWSTAKASWGKFACTFGGDGTIASRTADGSRVLKMKLTSGQGSGVAAISFTSIPGVSYVLQGFVNRNTTDGWTEFQLVDGADWSGWDNGGFCDALTIAAANTWQSFGKTVVATGTTMSIVIKAGSNTNAYTQAFWDDITITPEPVSLMLLLPGILLLRRRRT